MRSILLFIVGGTAVAGFQPSVVARFAMLLGSSSSSSSAHTRIDSRSMQRSASFTEEQDSKQRKKNRFVSPAGNSNSKMKQAGNNNNKVKPRQKAKQQSFQLRSLPPPMLVSQSQQSPNRMEDEQENRIYSDTIAATCPHFANCAGCTVARAVDTPVVAAAERYFAKERYQGGGGDGGGSSAVAPTSRNRNDGSSDFRLVVPTAVTGWRTQAKLVAANKALGNKWIKNAGCVFGLYEQGSHEVLPIPDCVVHHPSINQAIALLESATAAANIGAYDETTREGDLRYVQLQTERSTGKVCLTLVWNASSQKETQPGLSRLVKQLEKQMATTWHSIWCHCNDGAGNNIFARNPARWFRLAGPEYLREPIPVAASLDDDDATPPAAAGWFYFTPLTFRQGNMDGFDRLANDVARAIPGGSKVCELYGGVGVLGLTALAYHQQQGDPLRWLRCSDENPANARCFHRSTESLFGGGLITSRSSSRRTSQQSSSDDDEGITFAELMNRDNRNDAVKMGSNNRSTTGEEMPTAANRVSYVVASAAKALLSGQALGANVLIVDPPRKGLEDEVMLELIKPRNREQPYGDDATVNPWPEDKMNWTNDVNLLIYVSCGFDALARDCDRLLSSRAGWSLKRSTGYLLFPGSDHVETLAIFQRR